MENQIGGKSRWDEGDLVQRDTLIPKAVVTKVEYDPLQLRLGWCYELSCGVGWYPESCLQSHLG